MHAGSLFEFSFLSGNRCASTSVSPIKSGAFSFTRKQKKIPAALKEARSNDASVFALIQEQSHKNSSGAAGFQVSANTENSSMSGYLQRSKGYKKHWKRLWFVIKNKVLYTYAASEVLRLRFLRQIYGAARWHAGWVTALPFRMSPLWRVSLCWGFSWERRRTGRLRNCSSSCITKTRCFTFLKPMTSPQRKGIWIVYF